MRTEAIRPSTRGRRGLARVVLALILVSVLVAVVATLAGNGIADRGSDRAGASAASSSPVESSLARKLEPGQLSSPPSSHRASPG